MWQWLFGFSHRTSHRKKAPEDIIKHVSQAAKDGKPAKANLGATPHWVTRSARWDVRKASAGLAAAAEHNTAQHHL